MLGLCYWVGVNKKIQIQGNLCPFFLGVDLIVFPPFTFFQNLSPPLTHRGAAVFLNIGLTQTCIAIAPPHMRTLPKQQVDDKAMQYPKVKNKVFECLTFLKIEFIEYRKIGFKMA